MGTPRLRAKNYRTEALVAFPTGDVLAVQEFQEGNRVFTRDAVHSLKAVTLKRCAFRGARRSRSLSIAER